jgi:hypothetical protein
MASLWDTINPLKPVADIYSGVKQTLQTGGYNPIPKIYNNVMSDYGSTQSASFPAGQGTQGPAYGPSKSEIIQPTISLAGSGPAAVGGSGVNPGPNLAALESEYQTAIGTLNRQGDETSQQYGLYQTQAGTQSNQAITEAQSQQKSQLGGLETSKQAVGQNTQTAIGQARQSYNELQQRNNAYLSAQGISSSSAAEAMQEGLSRNTLTALNNLTQNKDTALQTIESEKNKVDEFYGRQITNIRDNLTQTQNQIGLEMRVQLGKIQDSKNLAASQKQQAANGVIQQAAAANAAAASAASQNSTAWNTFQQAIKGFYGNLAGFATGNINMNDFNNRTAQINAGLKGFQIDPATIANAVSTGVAPTQIFTPVQTTLVPSGQSYQAVDMWGNPVKK